MMMMSLQLLLLFVPVWLVLAEATAAGGTSLPACNGTSGTEHALLQRTKIARRSLEEKGNIASRFAFSEVGQLLQDVNAGNALTPSEVWARSEPEDEEAVYGGALQGNTSEPAHQSPDASAPGEEAVGEGRWQGNASTPTEDQTRGNSSEPPEQGNASEPPVQEEEALNGNASGHPARSDESEDQGPLQGNASTPSAGQPQGNVSESPEHEGNVSEPPVQGEEALNGNASGHPAQSDESEDQGPLQGNTSTPEGQPQGNASESPEHEGNVSEPPVQEDDDDVEDGTPDGRRVDECYTAVEGEECHSAVVEARHDGILQHPERYLGLTHHSSFEEFQDYLRAQGEGNCRRPCNLCHTAVQGDGCWEKVWWAMLVGIREHPEWYPGLASGSSFEEFQSLLHRYGGEQGDCPTEPCNLCRLVTEPGELCYKDVDWAMTSGIHRHPEWYPGLSSNASRTEFQEFLSLKYSCPPACDLCHTAEAGEDCYTGATWAKRHGITQHPEWYPGLTADSSLQDFQAYLHRGRYHNCPMPCNFKAE